LITYAALIGALSAEELQTLSYLLTAPLSMLARDGDALGAISVQQRLIEARGVDAKGYNLGLLAELELSARLPERALVSYERALARDHDDSYAQSAAQLRAYLAGAELPKAPPIKVDRPWVIVEDDETYVDWPGSEANPQVLRAMMGELPFVQFRTASGWLALTKTLAMFAMMSQSFEIEESMSTPEERSEGIAGAFGLDKLPPVEVLNASTVRLNGVEFPLPDGFCQEAGCSKPTRHSVDEYKELFAFLGFEVL